MSTAFDKLFDDIFNPGDMFPDLLSRYDLAMDEQGDHWVATVEMPGVKIEDLEVSVVVDRIHIKGQRKGSKSKTFERFFHPGVNVDLSKIDASLSDGLLELIIPKQKINSPRMIKVKNKRV